jgi:hypothetical protein
MIDVPRICEFLAYWLGGTTRREIAALLSYTPRHVTTLIQEGFGRLGRTTVRYDEQQKLWVPVDQPKGGLLGPRTTRDAVAILAAAASWGPKGLPGLALPIVDTNRFRVDPPPETFRILLAACMRRMPVHITYRSRTQDFAAAFSPHSLVRSAHRLHFRGYSLFEEIGRGHYWDLVPSRVLPARPAEATDYVDASGDEEWHRRVTLHLALHDHVPPPIRAALRREHDILTDHLDIGPLPQALLHYVRAEYVGRRYEGYEGEVWRSLISPEIQ